MIDKKTLDLARQWAADIDAGRQTLSQDTIDAAAEVISSLPDEGVPDGDPIETGDDHASHCASCAEMDDDEQVLDPAYTYRDKDGEHWSYINHNWRCINYGQDATNYLTPPAEYGPYTRIVKENHTNE